MPTQKSYTQLDVNTLLEQQRKEVVEEIEKWISENHSHHEFADELLPKGCYGCTDKDHPYVNSMDLVSLINSLK